MFTGINQDKFFNDKIKLKEEWKKLLPEEVYKITREKVTEIPFTGEDNER